MKKDVSVIEFLMKAYCDATECQLATYKGLKLRKKVPKCELHRQREICCTMLARIASLRAQGILTHNHVKFKPRTAEFFAQALQPSDWLDSQYEAETF